jgi:hypothetical protein
VLTYSVDHVQLQSGMPSKAISASCHATILPSPCSFLVQLQLGTIASCVSRIQSNACPLLHTTCSRVTNTPK